MVGVFDIQCTYELVQPLNMRHPTVITVIQMNTAAAAINVMTVNAVYATHDGHTYRNTLLNEENFMVQIIKSAPTKLKRMKNQ